MFLNDPTYTSVRWTQTITKHIITKEEGAQARITNVTAECSPALLKILDEIVSNAQDHQKRDAGVTTISVEIDQRTGLIKVCNNGTMTVPTRPFEEGSEKTVAEVIFGTLLSGSNFNDDEQRQQVGRNGMGGKLTNIYSLRFEILLVDPERNVEYFQRWENNMSKCHPPKVKKSSKKKAQTEVTFLPDYKRFGMEVPLDDNVFLLLKSRVQDVAVTIPSKVRVTFNGETINESSPKQLGMCFNGQILSNDKFTSDNGSSLEVCVSHTPQSPVSFSFVNGTRCKGTAYDMVLRKLTEAVNSKYPQATRISSILKDELSLVVNACVINPTFTSQTKEILNLPPSKLGFDYTVSSTFAKKLVDALRPSIEASMEKKTDKESSKAIKSKSGPIANFQRPTKLGKKPCTLFVCEGKSAQQMVVAGFRKIGREYYGVYPLKGKILNTMDEKVDEIVKNTEILDLIHILSLDPKKTYDKDSIRKLPFQNVVILTDQDFDGLWPPHGFFQNVFSVAADPPSYLSASFLHTDRESQRSADKTLQVVLFATDFQRVARGPQIERVQLLQRSRTSSDKEAIEYFSDLKKHTADFVFADNVCHEVLSKWFGKQYANERKLMLQAIDHDSCVDYAKSTITVKEFCDGELVHWSYANVYRTIPGLDGMKPSHRKVMHTLLQDKKPHAMKVAELAAKTIGYANYHSGEASLQETIAHMQQDYIGTNQIVFLEGLSQYGSRDDDTKTHAAPRYAKTQFHPVARLMMVPSEDEVLERVEDDGKLCEPKMYATVLPMVLLNGCEGIGTGYSTKIPEYSAKEVLVRCKHLAMQKDLGDFPPLKPQPHDFKGRVVEEDASHFTYHGHVQVATLDGKTVLQITELPPGMWTNPTKEHIEKWSWVKQADVVSTGVDVDIRIQVGDDKSCDEHLAEVQKYICKKVNTTNMYAFNMVGVLTKFETPEEILQEHASFKLNVCQKRLDVMIRNMEEKIGLATAKMQYIRHILEGRIPIVGIKTEVLKSKICEYELEAYMSNLLLMQLTSVTEEEMDKMRSTVDILHCSLDNLKQMNAHQLWLEDLTHLEEHLFPQGTKRPREDE